MAANRQAAVDDSPGANVFSLCPRGRLMTYMRSGDQHVVDLHRRTDPDGSRVYGFLSIVGVDTSWLTRKTDRRAEDMYDEFADPPGKRH